MRKGKTGVMVDSKGKTGVMVDSPEQAIVILYPSQEQKNADYVFYQKHILCIA
jgi:hypothetical protein